MKLRSGGVADNTFTSLDQPSQCSSAHGSASCEHPSDIKPPWSLTATQVSSRELAGKKLQGYDKRDITYEVHTVCLAKLFITDT